MVDFARFGPPRRRCAVPAPPRRTSLLTWRNIDDEGNRESATRSAKAAHLIVGGYGLMLSFYLAGAESVPRRFAAYPAELANGPFLANVSLVFILILFGGLALYLWDTGRLCARALRA